jgi:hypothetical protein
MCGKLEQQHEEGGEPMRLSHTGSCGASRASRQVRYQTCASEARRAGSPKPSRTSPTSPKFVGDAGRPRDHIAMSQTLEQTNHTSPQDEEPNYTSLPNSKNHDGTVADLGRRGGANFGPKGLQRHP